MGARQKAVGKGMSKIAGEINAEMTKQLDDRKFSRWPSAWEVWVSRPDKNQGWVRYQIYDNFKQAEATVKRVEGPPLVLKIVPLYHQEQQ